MNAQQFMQPVHYAVLSKDETDALQREAADLRAVVEDLKRSWVERARAQARLGEVEQKLTASHFAEKIAGTRRTL